MTENQTSTLELQTNRKASTVVRNLGNIIMMVSNVQFLHEKLWHLILLPLPLIEPDSETCVAQCPYRIKEKEPVHISQATYSIVSELSYPKNIKKGQVLDRPQVLIILQDIHSMLCYDQIWNVLHYTRSIPTIFRVICSISSSVFSLKHSTRAAELDFSQPDAAAILCNQ